MQGAIVCLGGEFVVIQMGSLRLTHHETSYVVGTAKYYKKIIDQYIARLILETTGPLHIFNAYIDDHLTTPASWVKPLFERLTAFQNIDAIEAPVFHNRNEWITAVPGLQLTLTTHDLPERVLVRDGTSILTLVRNPTGIHELHNIIQDNNCTDAVVIQQLLQDTSELRSALKSTFAAIEKSAQSLAVANPYDVDVASMIDRWCVQNTDPLTCATCISLMCDESAAFNSDHLNPLRVLASQNDEGSAKIIAVVKRDHGNSGMGIRIDQEGIKNGFYIISYGVNDIGQLIIPGVEAIIASSLHS